VAELEMSSDSVLPEKPGSTLGESIITISGLPTIKYKYKTCFQESMILGRTLEIYFTQRLLITQFFVSI